MFRFEVEAARHFESAGTDEVVGKLAEAAAPFAAGARVQLHKARESRPEEVRVTLGVKVTTEPTWLIAKAATEGNLQVIPTWKSAAVG